MDPDSLIRETCLKQAGGPDTELMIQIMNEEHLLSIDVKQDKNVEPVQRRDYVMEDLRSRFRAPGFDNIQDVVISKSPDQLNKEQSKTASALHEIPICPIKALYENNSFSLTSDSCQNDENFSFFEIKLADFSDETSEDNRSDKDLPLGTLRFTRQTEESS